MEDLTKNCHWIDSYNSSWTREELNRILGTDGTQYLYEKLVQNGEISTVSQTSQVTTKRKKISRWLIFDSKQIQPNLLPKNLVLDAGFHFKDCLDAEDFEAMTSGMLEMQLKLGQGLLSQSELVNSIQQKVLVFNRLAHAYRKVYQQKPPVSAQREESSKHRGSLASIDTGERIGTQVLVELGLTTGLSLVFALLRQNWQQQQQNPGSNLLCNEVLKTALRVLMGLPMMSLSNLGGQQDDISQSSLKQVNEFLTQSMNPANIGWDLEGAQLSSEVLLLLAIQRGKLSLLLQWIYSAIEESKAHPDLTIRTDILQLAYSHIRSISGSKSSVSLPAGTIKTKLGQAATGLLGEVVHQQSGSMLKGSGKSRSSSSSGSSSIKNEAFVWGSNSSHQLAEGAQEKIMLPKKTATFQDVYKMEAGQYCTFVISDSGLVNAVGKGSYGRLGLGDSTNQSIPRKLSISTPVRAVSTSRGSDGHSLALTEDGKVFSWGDGDYGKLGHGNAATQKSPKQIMGHLTGKVVVQISAGYRHSAAVTNEGQLYTWGEGDFGRLGHGDSQFRFVPTLVKDIMIGSVSCGAAHTLALSSDGKVAWSFGAGDHGKLGHGDTARHYRPKVIEALQGLDMAKVVAGNLVSFALTKYGEVWAWGSGPCLGFGSAEAISLAPQLIEDLMDVFVVDICIGDSHCLALTQDGTLYSWGINTMGQCGHGHVNSPLVRPMKIKLDYCEISSNQAQIRQISAGTSHSLAWTTPAPDCPALQIQKPFFVDMTMGTFDTLKKLLKSLDTSPDYVESLKNTLKILSCHLGILSGQQASLILDNIGHSDKEEFEALLYELVDADHCPPGIMAALINCLNEGMNLLLPPLEERLVIAKDLLDLDTQTQTLKKSQKIKLRLILQSINDPKAIGTLMQLESADVSQHVITLLKTLLLKDSQHLIESLILGNECPSDGLQNEERGLLFTIHTQFVLFNLNTEAENMVNFYDVRDIVMPYLKTLFGSGTHILEEGKKALSQNSSNRISEKFQEESALLKILYLTFVALMSCPVSAIIEVLQDLRKINKAGIELQKAVLKLSEADNDWTFLTHLNSLSATLLSKILSSIINEGSTEDVWSEHKLHQTLKPFRSSILVQGASFEGIEKARNLLPYLMKALNSQQSDNDEDERKRIFRLARFCLERFANNCAEAIDVIIDLQKALCVHENILVGNYEILTVMALTYHLAARVTGVDTKDVFNLIEITDVLVQYNDIDEEAKTETWLLRLLTLLQWNIEPEKSSKSLKEMSKEILSLVKIPGEEMKFEAIIVMKQYQASRANEKKENIPLARDLTLDIWQCYRDSKHDKKAGISDLLCQLILTLYQQQQKSNPDHQWVRDNEIDRSPWIDALFEILQAELKVNKDSNVIQALVTAFSIESWRNFQQTWPKFVQLNEDTDVDIYNNDSVLRMFMILALLSCNNAKPFQDWRLICDYLCTTLEKTQKREESFKLAHTKDLTTFLNFILAPRRKSPFLQKTQMLEESSVHNCIDIIFQIECHPSVESDFNFRLTCLKTIQHMSPMLNTQESVRSNIIKHLFKRLYEVKWVENLPDLITPNNNEPKVEKMEVSFNLERSVLCNADSSSGQAVVHAPNGRGYCLTRRGFQTEGIYQWKMRILKDARGNEGICVGVSLGNVRDFVYSTTKDMWLYRSYNGRLYHEGEVTNPLNTLPEYSMDDTITVQLDTEEGKLWFSKNSSPLILAFDNLPTDKVELFPVVNFYTSNHGEKVQICDLIKVPKDPLMLCENPNDTLAEGILSLLRHLYDSGGEKWKSSIERYLSKVQMSLVLYTDDLAKLSTSSLQLGPMVSKLTIDLWPYLTFVLGTVTDSFHIGSLVKVSSNNSDSDSDIIHQGYVLGMTSLKSGHFKISGHPVIEATKSQIQAIKASSQPVEILHHFLNAKMLKLLHTISLWTRLIPKLIDPEPDEDDNGIEDDTASKHKHRKRSKKLATKEDLNLLLKEKRSASLPDGNRGSGSGSGASMGVELLTNQLVSSIMGEITGGNISGKSSQESLMSNDNEPMANQHPKAKSKHQIQIDQDVLIKMAALQSLSGQMIVEYMQDTCLYDAESDKIDVLNSIIKEALEEVQGKISDSDIKAKPYKRHFNILAMISVGLSRRKLLAKMDEKASEKPKAASRPSLRERLWLDQQHRTESDNDQSDFNETLIHQPLREMGFDNNLISDALRVLNMDGSDNSAQAINECATWMIDHIESRQLRMAASDNDSGSSSSQNIRSLQDIRQYFQPFGPSAGTTSRRMVPPWVSSFHGTLTPIQTRSRSSSRNTNQQQEILQAETATVTETCCICLQRIALNARQHVMQNHKGCGARLQGRVSECCGEIHDSFYWLCHQCLSDYEVSYSNFCITWNHNHHCTIKIRTAKRMLRSDYLEMEEMTEVQRDGALDLSLSFEDLAPRIGLSSCNKVQCVRDAQIGDLSLGLASIQDPKGPLRLRDDDLVADTILERASDWTSSTQLLLALLKRHLMEMSLPLANQVLMAALKQHDHPNMDKWLEFLGKNGLREVSFLFKLLVFWSRNIWKRSKSSEDNCKSIRSAICHIINHTKEDQSAKTKILKLTTQNLMNMALNRGSLGFDQATCSLIEDLVNNQENHLKVEENTKKKDLQENQDTPLVSPEELKLYDALACVVLSTKNSKQPWALETLAKVLKSIILSNPSVTFNGCNHADLDKILPEMAQLQWTLSGNMSELQALIPCPSSQNLAVLTAAKTAYVVNSEGFSMRLSYSNDEPLKGLIWSDNQDQEHSTGNDLIGFSESAIYIWDSINAGDPVEMNFNFGQSTAITSIVASNKDMNCFFVLATSNGQVCTPSTELSPLQIIPDKISEMRYMPKSQKVLIASKSGHIALATRQNNEILPNESLPKYFEENPLDGVRFSKCEKFILAWSQASNEVCVWMQNSESRKFDSNMILPHPCKVYCADLNADLTLAIGQQDGGVAIWSRNKSEKGFFHHQLLWGHQGQSVTQVEFHPNGDLLATGSHSLAHDQGIVNIWSLAIGTVVQTAVFDHPYEGPPVCLRWLGHRRLTIANEKSTEVTVILMPTNYDQEFNMDNVKVAAACRKAFMGRSEDLMRHTVGLKYLLSHWASLAQLQKINELPEERSLLASPFMKALVTMSQLFDLHHVFKTSEVLNVDLRTNRMVDVPAPKETWQWMIDAIETLKELQKMEAKESQENAQLIKWVNEHPLDWQLGGPCQAWMFGRNKEGQLADATVDNRVSSPDGQRPKYGPSCAEAQSVICGKNSTFVIKSNGDVYSCGEGSNGRLGHGNSDDLNTLSLITALRGFKIVQISSSVGDGGHVLAVAASGEIFSWGDGELGKLGHGTTDRVRRPKLISSVKVKGRSIRDWHQVSAGFRHSAILTNDGKLWTFGCGDNGRLGLGPSLSSIKKIPEQVQSISDVGQVACGFNHTICVSSDGKTTWSFGDGDHGKLGLGHCTSKGTPQVIEELRFIEIKKIGVGKNVSIFLTAQGEILACGSEELTGLSEVQSKWHKPCPVPTLQGVVIKDIDVGAEHILALTDKGQVYGWGNNFNSQLGLDPNIYGDMVSKPTLIPDLAEIKQISAGNLHSAAWTSEPISPQRLYGTPQIVPEKYGAIQHLAPEVLRERLMKLHRISDMLKQSWRLLPRNYNTCQSGDPLSLDTFRQTFDPSAYNLPLVRTLQATMTIGKQAIQQVAIKRYLKHNVKKRALKHKFSWFTTNKKVEIKEEEDHKMSCETTIFGQAFHQVLRCNSQTLRLPSQAWKVKLIGEGADDAGGVFDDTMSEMCHEISLKKSSGLNLLILSPNGKDEAGLNRDKYLLNVDEMTTQKSQYFRFLGILIGVAIRTNKPIALNLAPLVWKLLSLSHISRQDIEDVDYLYAKSLTNLEKLNLTESAFKEVIPQETFMGTTFTGKRVPLCSKGSKMILTGENRGLFVKLAFQQRIEEMVPAAHFVREGICEIAPVPIIDLMPISALETLVAGQPQISVETLKQVARYRNSAAPPPSPESGSNKMIDWFWQVLEEMSEEDRVLFMIFVSGRSRLPNHPMDFNQRFQILILDGPLNGLPTAQTCFFQLRLPPYTSKSIMMQKMLYAIKHCRCIDMDNYMLARNTPAANSAAH